MKSASIQSRDYSGKQRRRAGFDQFARRAVRARLEQVQNGQVVVREDGKHEAFGSLTDEIPLTTVLTIHDPRFYGEVAFGGAMGAAEAFIQGFWSCDELTNLVRILLRNRHVLGEMETGFASLSRPLLRFVHRRNRNTRSGSKRNIAAHYDLGNDFYELWLDRTMMYSSAVFERPDMALEDASVAKLDRICRKLRLKQGDRVLEIGTGWGGFAVHAAKHYGCHVTTTTISRRQFEYASALVASEGLADRIDLLMKDYRDLEGRFDKLVSIEMIEAVGAEFQPAFFARCSELLRPDGEMLLQAITIADQNYEAYLRRVDFIRRYIFPGGCLTSTTSMARSLTDATDMRIVHLEDIAPHYAETLRRWREAFHGRLDEVRALGYSEEFIRMWTYYLCYCEGAFDERAIGNVQLHIAKPNARVDVVGF
jgi:cyclopropane-fatty-acyl-phospholipid synthase